MSLDLYIESKTPVLHRGTGVYIRENGEMRELATKQEVLTHFPDANPDDIEERTYEDDEYFHLNLTHNLTDMAEKCVIESKHFFNDGNNHISLYDLVWHPEENLGIEVPSMDYIQDITSCYNLLLRDPNFYKKYNPENGWGNYEQLTNGVKKYLNALISISDNFENYRIIADT